jgi:trehalose 6-phosphate phosphatase
MSHLFDCWPPFCACLQAAGSVALFLDFDGTLATFREHPDLAQLGGPTRRALARLAQNRRAYVCIISGRRLADLRARTRLAGLRQFGLHGWENAISRRLDPEIYTLVEQTRGAIAQKLTELESIVIEQKGPVFSVHYRGAKEETVSRARADVLCALSTAKALRIKCGRQCWEILPSALGDKGSAVRNQLKHLPRKVLPIYVGDDATDEPAFAALWHGITIRVGPNKLSRARFQLRNPAEVRQFLERLAGEL